MGDFINCQRYFISRGHQIGKRTSQINRAEKKGSTDKKVEQARRAAEVVSEAQVDAIPEKGCRPYKGNVETWRKVAPRKSEAK